MPETLTPSEAPMTQPEHVVVITKSEKPMSQLLHEQAMERIRTEARLKREHWLTLFALFFLLAVSSSSLWIILRGGYPENTQKLAETIVTAIVSGLLGYLAGKQSGKEEK